MYCINYSGKIFYNNLLIQTKYKKYFEVRSREDFSKILISFCYIVVKYSIMISILQYFTNVAIINIILIIWVKPTQEYMNTLNSQNVHRKS